jgi:hypothetical protein
MEEVDATYEVLLSKNHHAREIRDVGNPGGDILKPDMYSKLSGDVLKPDSKLNTMGIGYAITRSVTAYSIS